MSSRSGPSKPVLGQSLSLSSSTSSDSDLDDVSNGSSSSSSSASLSPLAETTKQKKARSAFANSDAAASIAIHNASVGNAKEKHKKGGDYLKSIIYGGMDGIITTFAVVSGAAGAELGTGVILVMGFSNLVADGLSMGMGDYLSSKAEFDYAKAERKREAWEFDNYPEGEVTEMIEIYEKKGMATEDAKALMKILSSYKDIFVDTMMVDELGLMPPDPSDSPLKNGAVTFGAFAACGLVPLLAYLIASAFDEVVETTLFIVACILTAVTLFALGAVSSRFTIMQWWKSGAFYTAIGAVAAASSYFIGWGVSELVEAAGTSTGCTTV